MVCNGKVQKTQSYSSLLNRIRACFMGSGWSMTWVAFQIGEVKRLLSSTSLSGSPWASASTLLALSGLRHWRFWLSTRYQFWRLAVLLVNSAAVLVSGSYADQFGFISGITQQEIYAVVSAMLCH